MINYENVMPLIKQYIDRNPVEYEDDEKTKLKETWLENCVRACKIPGKLTRGLRENFIVRVKKLVE